MTYTEIKEKNKSKYYYRVRTLRNGQKFKKQRIYLGKNLKKKQLKEKEIQADKKLNENKLIPKIREILKKYNVKKAGIFGSYATQKQNKNSDIDIVIEPPKGIGFGFVGIQFDLEDNLKKKVDLLTYDSIHPLLKKRILKEEIQII
ncbi:nucleotidyltransferase family protein [Nanoarchaeota archaeon]